MKWILFALLAYFIFSITKIIDSISVKKYFRNPKIYLFYNMALQGIIGSLIFFFVDTNFYGYSFLFISFITGFFYVYGLIPYLKSLEFEEVSRVVPLFNLRPIFVLILSMIILGTKLSAIQYLGFAFLIAGGFLISIKEFKISKSLFYMIITSILFSFFLIGTQWLFQNYDYWSAFAYIQLGVLFSAFSLIVFKNYGEKGIKEIMKINLTAKILVISVAIISFIGIGIRNFAIGISSATLVSSLEGFQSLFVFIMTLIFSFKAPKILKEETHGTTILLKTIAIILLIEGIWFVSM